MRYLTTYLDDEINFKSGNRGSIIRLKASDDHTVVNFTTEDKLVVKIKDANSYIDTIPVEADGKIVKLKTKQVSKLPVGEYEIELWHGEDDNIIIYPDEGFLKLRINQNVAQFNGEKVSTITLINFEAKFNELYKKIDDKLKTLPDIDGNINLDFEVKDGHLMINGRDTGVDLSGKDGHTPVIDISDKGTLVVDSKDTGKSIIGPQGKSAYQVAIDNGFDGTEVEWLRSLHGNDGLDGQPGVRGESAYDIAKEHGFNGTEKEWLQSLHGKDGMDGKNAEVTQVARHAPTGWTLDRTTNPWTIWFDNGCGMQYPSYSQLATIYGYGFDPAPYRTSWITWPLVSMVMSAAHGTLTLDAISKVKAGADYWAEVTIINPIKSDASSYDWSNVYFNDDSRAGNNDYPNHRQKYYFKACYELGIFTAKDLEPFGLVKKEGN